MLAGTILGTSHAEHTTGGDPIAPFPEDVPDTSTRLRELEGSRQRS